MDEPAEMCCGQDDWLVLEMELNAERRRYARVMSRDMAQGVNSNSDVTTRWRSRARSLVSSLLSRTSRWLTLMLRWWEEHGEDVWLPGRNPPYW